MNKIISSINKTLQFFGEIGNFFASFIGLSKVNNTFRANADLNGFEAEVNALIGNSIGLKLYAKIDFLSEAKPERPMDLTVTYVTDGSKRKPDTQTTGKKINLLV